MNAVRLKRDLNGRVGERANGRENRSRPFIAFAFTLLLVGCEVGPNYTKPKEKVPKQFGELQATTAPSQLTDQSAQLAEWWRTFDDSELNSLIKRALKQNLDLQQAESRIRQARYERVIATGELFPNIDATAGYQHARGSKNIVIPPGAFGGSSEGKPGGNETKGSALRPPGAAPAQVSAAGQPSGGPQSPLGEGGFPGVETDLYQAGFDATWELDIFGGTRRSIEAASANLGAAVEDRRSVLVSMLAEIARTYVDLRGLQRQEAIARQNLSDQQEMISIIKEKQRVGLVTDLDVSQQDIELANTAATIPQLDAQAHMAVHELGILLSENPDALTKELLEIGDLPSVPVRVPIGLPSELLLRRPDIRESERKLAAAIAQIGVTKAQLFPQFSVTGSFGLDSSQPSHLLDWDSRYFLISPGVDWPIFDAGQIRGRVAVSREIAKQALLSYRQTILQALREVDDAISNYRQEQIRQISLCDAVNASSDAVSLAHEQYRDGVVDFIVVIDAQRSLLASEDALAQSERTVDADLVALYKALGGGWQKS